MPHAPSEKRSSSRVGPSCRIAVSLIIVCTRNAIQRQQGLGLSPVLIQLKPVIETPLPHERLRARGQLPFEKDTIIDPYEPFVTLVFNMNMWRSMICEVHSNIYAEEASNDRHDYMFRRYSPPTS